MKAIIPPRPAMILVVDDERVNRDEIEAMLSAEGFGVVTAASGEEALAIVAERAPDLILLDVLMPDMNGHELTRRVKSNIVTRNIPIIIMVTAIDDGDARLGGLGAGAEDFITTPLDRSELCIRVRNMLRQKASSDQALARRDESMDMVNHELRNAMSGLLLRAALLEAEASGTVEGERVVAAARLMQRQGKQIQRLIEDLVDVVRTDAGGLAPHSWPCDARALLNDAVSNIPSPPSISPVATAAAPLRGRILVLDDDQAICETMARYLIRRGFTAEWSTSPLQAIQIMGERDFDVVITDLRMPDMDGIDLTRHIVRVSPDLPVIVTSAFGSAETRDQVLAAGAHRFMSKPYDLEVLFSELRQAITVGKSARV